MSYTKPRRRGGKRRCQNPECNRLFRPISKRRKFCGTCGKHGPRTPDWEQAILDAPTPDRVKKDDT